MVVGYSHILQDLEKRGKGYGCATQAGEDRVLGRAPLFIVILRSMVRVVYDIVGETREEGFVEVTVIILVGSIHGTGLMTEEYTPKHCRPQTAQNKNKNMIVFWLSVTPLAICDTFSLI